MARETFVLRNGKLVEKRTGAVLASDPSAPLAMPMVISDISDYRSPVDGRLISSRSERREDLKRNNCIDARDMPSVSAGGFKNKRFAKKHGLTLGEAYRD